MLTSLLTLALLMPTNLDTRVECLKYYDDSYIESKTGNIYDITFGDVVDENLNSVDTYDGMTLYVKFYTNGTLSFEDDVPYVAYATKVTYIMDKLEDSLSDMDGYSIHRDTSTSISIEKEEKYVR